MSCLGRWSAALIAGVVVSAPLVGAEAGLGKVVDSARKGADKAADSAGKAVSGASQSAASSTHAAHALMKEKTVDVMPKYTAGMFARFAPNASHDWTNAFLLSLASHMAYFNRELVDAFAKTVGFTRFTWLHNDGAQGYVASNERFVLACFRGTEAASLRDILTDLDLETVKGYEGKVHKGSHRATAKLLPSLLDAVKAHAPSRARPLWVTGHSLGGAIGLLSAVRLKAAGHEVRGLYTYGQVKVGNRVFVDRFKTPLYRFVNENDPVPYAPIALKAGDHKSGYFEHVGKMFFFDQKGRYRAEETRLPPAEKNERLFQILAGGGGRHGTRIYTSVLYPRLPAELRALWPVPFP